MASNKIFARYKSPIRNVISCAKKAPKLLKKCNKWGGPDRCTFPYTVWETAKRSMSINNAILNNTEDQFIKRKKIYNKTIENTEEKY